MPKIIDDNQIYHAIMRAVGTRGYAGTTTKQMAETAGISEVTLFRKYGSKAQLVRRAMVALAEQADFATVAHYTGDISDDLLRVVRHYQSLADHQGRFFYTMLVEVPRHPDLADLLDAPASMMTSVGQLLVRYQQEGVLRDEHPLHALACLIGPLLTANMMRAARTEMVIPPIDLPRHVAHYLDGHRTATPRPDDARPVSGTQRP